jgi:hypothetical protein
MSKLLEEADLTIPHGPDVTYECFEDENGVIRYYINRKLISKKSIPSEVLTTLTRKRLNDPQHIQCVYYMDNSENAAVVESKIYLRQCDLRLPLNRLTEIQSTFPSAVMFSVKLSNDLVVV